MKGTHEEPISAKNPENPPHCQVPLKTLYFSQHTANKIKKCVNNVVSTNDLKTQRMLGKCHNQYCDYIVQGIRIWIGTDGFFKTK